MRILFIATSAGDGGLDIAMRLEASGHEVKFFAKPDERRKDVGNGLITRVPDWREWARWADLVILADNTKYLKELDAWRARGTTVVGATEASAQWELDRAEGQQALKRAGIPVLPAREFDDYDKAIAYVKREGRRFVSKPCGDEKDKSLSYVARSPADLVYMLERWKRTGKLKASFLLQEFVAGCEMAVGGWFGPNGFADVWLENWEFKKLMTGNLGPATGEMGTALRYVKRSKLADKVLKPMAGALEKLGHTGYVDVNCIIGDDGTPWPLEFTTRMGWPTTNILTVLHEGDMGEWLACLSEGRDGWRPRVKLNLLALGVILALPDYPYSHATRKEVTGVPIYGLSPSLMEHIHPCEMMMGEAPKDVRGKVVTVPMMTSAGDYVLIATGTGETVREARTACYRTLKKIEAPASPFYRTDIGLRLKKELPGIQAHGYATNLTF